MKIALVGAFDRNNYGDVLMPIVFKKQLLKALNDIQIHFDYYGLQEANMEYIKGNNTMPLFKLYESGEYYDAVVIVGGEVLTSKYTNMYLNLQTDSKKIKIYQYMKKVFPKLIELICRYNLKGKEKYPWIIDKDKINCKYLIYNTVGGKSISQSKEVKNIIKKIDYISLRDKETYKKILKINNKAKLYPDSVIALSQIFNDDDLEKEVSGNIKKEIKNIGKYFVLQVKRNKGEDIWLELVKQIEVLNEKHNMICVLLPIGYAQGHEDQFYLKKIHDKLSSKTILINNNNLYDTMYIIKNSKAYIGTSLHGAITAISYMIPHMCLTNKIQKQIDFIKTWNTTPILYTEAKDLSCNLMKVLNNEKTYKMLQESKNKILAETDKNLLNIVNILKGK